MKVAFIRYCDFTFQGVTHDVFVDRSQIVEIHTFGWASGARTRVRRAKDFSSALAYLARLQSGGYLSDDDFLFAERKLRDLGQTVASDSSGMGIKSKLLKGFSV